MRWILRILCLSALSLSLGCGGKSERAPATTSGGASNLPRPTTTAPSRPTRVAETDPRGSEVSAVSDPDNIYGRTLDEINADSPLRDVPFDFDSAVLLESARPILDRTAEWLRSYSAITLLVEGHCDERGTTEYNIGLGERRAAATKAYLVSLGVPAERVAIVSKGKESPFCTQSDESCWSQNRRGHFIITAK